MTNKVIHDYIKKYLTKHVYSIKQYYKIQVHIYILVQTQFIYPTCTFADQHQNLHKNCLYHLTIIGQDDTLIQVSCTRLAYNLC